MTVPRHKMKVRAAEDGTSLPYRDSIGIFIFLLGVSMAFLFGRLSSGGSDSDLQVLKNRLENLTLLHETEVQDMQSAHDEQVARLQRELLSKETQAQQCQSRENQIILELNQVADELERCLK